LKNACANEFSATVDQLCIIYSGKMLGDSEVLSDCGVYDGATVHLVIQSAHHVCIQLICSSFLCTFTVEEYAADNLTPKVVFCTCVWQWDWNGNV